ncbi:MAG: DNA-binding protein [Variovorax sp.]
MSLQNLLRIGKLKVHEATALELKQLMVAARRNLADAGVTEISDETRFDAAYKAVMQCALAAMMAAGFRPSTSEPGHHLTLIQSLPLTLGIGNDTWIVLDALRRKRNANDYTGDIVTGDMVDECAGQGRRLLTLLGANLEQHRPDVSSG